MTAQLRNLPQGHRDDGCLLWVDSTSWVVFPHSSHPQFVEAPAPPSPSARPARARPRILPQRRNVSRKPMRGKARRVSAASATNPQRPAPSRNVPAAGITLRHETGPATLPQQGTPWGTSALRRGGSGGGSWRRRLRRRFSGPGRRNPAKVAKVVPGRGQGLAKRAAFTTFSAFPAPAGEKSRVAGRGRRLDNCSTSSAH